MPNYFSRQTDRCINFFVSLIRSETAEDNKQYIATIAFHALLVLYVLSIFFPGLIGDKQAFLDATDELMWLVIAGLGLATGQDVVAHFANRRKLRNVVTETDAGTKEVTEIKEPATPAPVVEVVEEKPAAPKPGKVVNIAEELQKALRNPEKVTVPGPLAGTAMIMLPPHMEAAFKRYGLKELPGKANAAAIMAMAEYLGVKQYTADSIPWCGLFAAYCLRKGGMLTPPPEKLLLVANWPAELKRLGYKKIKPEQARFGDVVISSRSGGNHIAFMHYRKGATLHLYGGNQSDSVNTAGFSPSRITSVWQPPYSGTYPAVKAYTWNGKAEMSKSEA